jgi:spermidine synthase
MHDFAWGRFRRIVDVGGSGGSMLHRLLAAHPGATGVLFDLPDVVDRARAAWAEGHADMLASGRVEFVAGDFLGRPESIPRARDGDVYMM